MSSNTSNNSFFNNIGDGFNDLQQNSSSMMNNAGESFNNFQNDISNRLNQFSDTTNTAISGTTSSGFADSNGLIAKFAFFCLVVICFLIGLNLGIVVLSYFLKPSNKVMIIDGMIDGGSKYTISQDANSNTSKLIRRSNNEKTGIEFSWCVWLRLDSVSNANTYQPIFVKGDSPYNSQNISSISNGPGVYFAGTNSLHIMMDTVSKYAANEISPSTMIVDISNIPLKKWFHLVIRCQNKYLDIYINGLVVYRTNLINVPLQNYDNIRVCDSGGFIGKLSNLIYYNYALNTIDINGIANSGPNLTDADTANKFGTVGSSYLSTLWYKP